MDESPFFPRNKSDNFTSSDLLIYYGSSASGHVIPLFSLSAIYLDFLIVAYICQQKGHICQQKGRICLQNGRIGRIQSAFGRCAFSKTPHTARCFPLESGVSSSSALAAVCNLDCLAVTLLACLKQFDGLLRVFSAFAVSVCFMDCRCLG